MHIFCLASKLDMGDALAACVVCHTRFRQVVFRCNIALRRIPERIDQKQEPVGFRQERADAPLPKPFDSADKWLKREAASRGQGKGVIGF